MPSRYGNTSFYNSSRWKKVAKSFMASKNFVCEICGAPAKICHHKIWLNAENVRDPNIALDWSNLQAVCIDCHNRIHYGDHARIDFDQDGNIIEVEETSDATSYAAARDQIDSVLARARSLSVVSCGDDSSTDDQPRPEVTPEGPSS